METVKKYLMKSVYRRFAIFSATLLIVLILLSFFNTPLVSFILAVTAFYAIGELVHFLLGLLFSQQHH
jgi:predicted PurR-regulated permease PerM